MGFSTTEKNIGKFYELVDGLNTVRHIELKNITVGNTCGSGWVILEYPKNVMNEKFRGRRLV